MLSLQNVLTGYNTEQNYLQQKEGGCQEVVISAMCINIVLVYHQMLLKIITIAAKYFECTFLNKVLKTEV